MHGAKEALSGMADVEFKIITVQFRLINGSNRLKSSEISEQNVLVYH